MWNFDKWPAVVEWAKRAFAALIIVIIYQLTGIDLGDQFPPAETAEVQQFAEAEPDQICEYVVKIEGRALSTQELIVQAQEGLPGGGKVIDIDFFDVERTEKLTIGPGEDLTDEAMKRVQLHPDLPTGFIFGKWDERPKVTIINRQCRKYQEDRDDVPDTLLPEAPEGPTKQPPKNVG